MARYRTIKPEFWSSIQVIECSTSARLLFIGIWNFCDDYGRMENSARALKARVFPGDDDVKSDDIALWLDELSENGLIAFYDIDGKEYFYVTGWHHQRIDKPSKSSIPAPLVEQSENALGTIQAASYGKKESRKERKKEAASAASGRAGVSEGEPASLPGIEPPNEPERAPSKADEAILLKAALDEWNATAKAIGARTALGLDARRRASLRKRLAELGGLEAWSALMVRISTSAFLRGDTPRQAQHANWRPSLDWVLRPETQTKLREGHFDDVKAPPAGPPANRSNVTNLPVVPRESEAEVWDGRLRYYAKTGVYQDGWFPERDKLPAELGARFDRADLERQGQGGLAL